MATFDSGPASLPASGVTTFVLPGGPVVEGIEVHVGGSTPTSPDYSVNYPGIADNGTGTNPLPPVSQVWPPADPSIAPTTITGNALTQTNTSLVNGVTGGTILFRNPA